MGLVCRKKKESSDDGFPKRDGFRNDRDLCRPDTGPLFEEEFESEKKFACFKNFENRQENCTFIQTEIPLLTILLKVHMGAFIEFNTDGLAKLAETICHGLGITAYGHKKMADAEAYAAIKRAETETQVAILNLKREEEIADYVLVRESRKLSNVQSVIEKAKEHFIEGEPVSNKPVNQDWTNRFLSIVEDISDETLHQLWGHILAGEVKQPDSYSLRTLELLRNVTKEEAELFVKSVSFYLEKDFICTEDFALSLHETLLLGEIGFLNNEELVKTWKIEAHNKLEIILDNKNLLVLVNNTDKQVNCSTSVKKLSKAGREIFSIIEKVNRNSFYHNLATFLKSKGVSQIFMHEIVEYGEQCKYKRQGIELIP